MPLARCVLLERVLYRYSLVHQELAIHTFYGLISRFKAVEGYKPEAFAATELVSLNLCWLDKIAEVTEGVPKCRLVDVDVQVANEEVRPDVDLLLVR